MKKFSLVICLLGIMIISFGQTSEKEMSNLEKFSAKSGTLIQKDFTNVGSVKGISIQVAKLKDLNSDVSLSALRFEYEYKGNYSSDTKIAVLDKDEIEGLIESIKNYYKD